MDNLDKKYRTAISDDSVCGVCGFKMKLIKGKKRKRYGKVNNYYLCECCGNRFRVRTQNEVLRDMGERDESSIIKEYKDTEQEVWSDCCSAEIIMGDICSECREHCDAVPCEEEDDDDS